VVEERAGVHLRRIADVATFRIGNDKLVGMMLTKVLHRLLEGHDALHAERFVECHVRLIGYAIGSSGFDNRLVESEDRVFLLQEVLRNLLDVRIQTDTEERLLPPDILDELLFVHNVFRCF